MHIYTVIIIYIYLCISTFLLVLNNILLFGFTTQQFIHSPTERHHGCFQTVAVMSKTCEQQRAGVWWLLVCSHCGSMRAEFHVQSVL